MASELNFSIKALPPCNPGSSYPGDLRCYGGGGGRQRAREMSIEIVSLRGKACLISAHLDFMMAQKSAHPDRAHYSYILF